ncbi:MAG: hypothetical protein JNG84_00335 [Archangium sp.]|nr:hypothetical protein [Archangium sp.]
MPGAVEVLIRSRVASRVFLGGFTALFAWLGATSWQTLGRYSPVPVQVTSAQPGNASGWVSVVDSAASLRGVGRQQN